MAQDYYPILVTDKFSDVINFYEDHFDFVPELEMECFAVLKHEKELIKIGIVKEGHKALPASHQKKTQGLIINLPVKNIKEAFKHYYYEGMEIKVPLALAPCGRRHFMIEDPNGNLIDVMEEYDPFAEINDNDDDEELMELLKNTAIH